MALMNVTIRGCWFRHNRRPRCQPGLQEESDPGSLQAGGNSPRSLNCYRWPLSAVGRFRLGGQVWLGIENIKSRETANAVKQLSLKPALLNRVGLDWLGRFGLALKRPNHQNMLKNSEVITIFMQVTIFPTECSVISCCSNNVETYNYALWWAGSAW